MVFFLLVPFFVGRSLASCTGNQTKQNRNRCHLWSGGCIDLFHGILKLGHIGRRRQFRRAYFRSFVPFSPKLRPQPQLFPMYFPLWNREHYLSRTNFSNICFSIKITKICFPHFEIPKKVWIDPVYSRFRKVLSSWDYQPLSAAPLSSINMKHGRKDADSGSGSIKSENLLHKGS